DVCQTEPMSCCRMDILGTSQQATKPTRRKTYNEKRRPTPARGESAAPDAVAQWRCGAVALWRCGAVALWRCRTLYKTTLELRIAAGWQRPPHLRHAISAGRRVEGDLCGVRGLRRYPQPCVAGGFSAAQQDLSSLRSAGSVWRETRCSKLRRDATAGAPSPTKLLYQTTRVAICATAQGPKHA